MVPLTRSGAKVDTEHDHMTQSAEQAITARLSGIQRALMGLFLSGDEISAASRGRERERFINLFLEKVFPPGYRFGSGDAIDTDGNQSGQLDVVVEFTFLPSFPALASEPRLYLAEGIAAVIEIKSDLQRQWSEVERTAPLKNSKPFTTFLPFNTKFY